MVDSYELIAMNRQTGGLLYQLWTIHYQLASNLYHLPKSVLLIGKLSCAISVEPINSDGIRAVDLGSPVFNPDPWFLLRKEVIQPQVPLRLPCYDFIPITIHTFGAF